MQQRLASYLLLVVLRGAIQGLQQVVCAHGDLLAKSDVWIAGLTITTWLPDWDWNKQCC